MIISATILLLILVPIILSMILSLPLAQNRVVAYATAFATDYLQTEVSLGRIDISMLGEIQATDFLVRDLDGDTLLYTKHLTSRIAGYSRSQKRLTLGNSEIETALLNLRQTTRGEMNIREITQKLASKRSNSSNLSIFINSAKLSRMRLRIEQLTHANPEYGVDVKNIRLNDLEGEVSDLLIDGATIHAQVEKLSAQEHSGFHIQQVSGELYLTHGALAITDMSITTQWSSLTLPYLMLTSAKWADYKDFNQNTDLSFSVTNGYLSSDDLAYFSPSMVSYGVILYDLDLSVTGEVDSLQTTITNISYGESTHITATAALQGLPDRDSFTSQIDIQGISTSANDILHLCTSLNSEELPHNTTRIISDADAITLRGEMTSKRGLRDISLDMAIESNLGEITAQGEISMDGQNITTNCDIAATNLNVGQILNSKELGRTTLRTTINGNVGEHKQFETSSSIEYVELDGKILQNISALTNIASEDVTAQIAVDDPKLRLNLDVDAKGLIADSDPQVERSTNCSLNLDLEHADLKELGLNRRDTTSVVSANLSASIIGSSIEDAYIEVELSDGEYYYNSNQISTGAASLFVRSAEDDREINLKSQFFDVDFHSSSQVKHIIEYLRSAMYSYLPSLYNNSPQIASDTTALGSGLTSSLSIITHNISPIAGAIMSDLEVANGSSVLLSFNEQENLFDLRFKSDFIERKALLAIGIDSHITNKGDSLTLNSLFNELYVGTNCIRGANILASAKSDNILLESHFTNPADSISADIHTALQLNRIASGKRVLSAEILPSRVVQKDRMWSLGAREIEFKNGGVKIDNFIAESEEQRLLVNGYASNSQSDTLRMEMRDFDLSILSTFISKIGYHASGRTNGQIVASSALDNAKLQAHIALDSVKINTIEAPAMEMDVTWDSKLNRARLILENRATRDTLVRGYYIPSQVKYYARCEVDSLNVGLLDPPLGGVITDTEGYARLDLTLEGHRREADLTGLIDVTNFKTKVDYTGVTYKIPSATINVKNNKLIGSNIRCEDTVGGSGAVDLEVDLQHLSNISYSLRILPNKMMVLNTTIQDNEVFYGELYASGMAQISGDKSGVKMNITASSEENSHFYMPLSDKEVVSVADFIHFVQPTVIDSLDSLAARRRTFVRKTQGGSGAMVINMSLDVKPNLEMQLVIDPTVGDIIKARGEGQLNLSLEPKANRFDIYGDYTIEEGSYLFTLQNIVNKRFVIDPGSSIQWTGSPTNARLNINAIYKLKASLQPLISDESSRAIPVDCIIRLTEMLTQPDVNFSIDLPSSDGETQAMFNNLVNNQESISRQFFYLMLANSFIAESSGGRADLGASAGAATGFELLTNQLSNWLSSSNYNVIIRYRPESELTGDELDVGFSKGLVNNRLLVELEGNYVTDNAATTASENVSNFMGEAYITWLIDRAGALRLKGFTQTIDRFDENQGLQETGIGVYYRESFNNFADLREKVRARFSASPERLVKREERRRRREERRALQSEFVEYNRDDKL